MNKFVFIILAAIVIAGSAMTGLLSPSQNRQSEILVPSCVDFDPPNASVRETLNGVSYNLIKEDAWMPEGKFQGEMVKVGTAADGREIYQLKKGKNKFNDSFDPSIFIYVLRRSDVGATRKDGSMRNRDSYYFDIYFKDGTALPDFVRNCKSRGRAISVAQGTTIGFPPQAFNTKDIIGLAQPFAEPAWLYLDFNEPLSTILSDGATQVGTLSTSKGTLPVYRHLDTVFLIDGTTAYNYGATQDFLDLTKQGKESLQLQKFGFASAQTYSWWTPTCKPAIYLYPQERTEVHVRVEPKGYLTLTIPEYPKEGWMVTANPSGEIESSGRIYPYLYYESKIRDVEVRKPQNGYIVEFQKLSELYSNILPKLGLNDVQTNDFKEYWGKALPNAPYYFVGVMEQKDIDAIEPLTITPNPESIIRVRLYFEALKHPIEVQQPTLFAPQKQGFTVVEWGGMVKTDKTHPFTCSQ